MSEMEKMKERSGQGRIKKEKDKKREWKCVLSCGTENGMVRESYILINGTDRHKQYETKCS